ncbi:MAG: hypothetical protein RLZZ271_748 [Pseudomonadota bacterium]|jgi:RND family efflux transporter MFP subunit
MSRWVRQIGILVLMLLAGGLAVAQVGAKPKAGRSEISCVMEPSQEVNVGTPEDGILEYIGAERGDLVTAGQLLARLNSGVEAAAVDFQDAKAGFGARKKARNEDLQRKKLISEHELDEMSTEAKMAEMELREKRERLKLRSINSPIRGIVVDVYKRKGDLIKQEKIFRIAQVDPLHVETVLPTPMFSKIKAGQTYEVTSQLGGVYKARVSIVDKVIDAASGTFRVRLILPNPRYDVPSGQHCIVNFPA